MAERAAGAANELWTYSMPVGPSRERAAARASGSRSIPSTVAPASRRIIAWPPPPSVASTARWLPCAHACTAAERTGTWYGMERASEAAVGTLHNKKTPANEGRGARCHFFRAGLDGADGARTRDLRCDRPAL